MEGACTREPVTLATAVGAGTREVFMDRICGGGLGLVGGWRSPCVTVTVTGEGKWDDELVAYVRDALGATRGRVGEPKRFALVARIGDGERVPVYGCGGGGGGLAAGLRGDDGSGVVPSTRGADSELVLRERGEDNGLVPSMRGGESAGVRLNGGGGLAAGLRGDDGGELVLMERRVGGDAS